MELFDRMKLYEGVPKTSLITKMPVIGRLDGRAFHTLTRGMEKPWDERFQRAMWTAAAQLCLEVQGCRLAYVQSDEISLLLVDYATNETQSWFDYDLQKMCSIAASIATSAFNLELDIGKIGHFDARFFNLPPHEVANYFVWRQNDATRNSIQSLGQAHFSQKELHGKNNAQVQEMLFQQRGINWNDCPTPQKRGVCITRKTNLVPCNPPGFPIPALVARNSWMVDGDIPVFTQDRAYVERYLAPEWP